MKKTNFKLFTMFLAGILFSSIAVFAATISVSTNFGSAIQYLQKLVIKDYSNNQEKVTLDKNWIQITWNLVVDWNINWTNITWMNVNWENISWINITWTSINWTHINWTNINWEIVIGKTWKFEKYCDENGDNCKEISDMWWWGWESLWTSGDDKIYYQSWKVGIGTNITNNTLSVSGSANIWSVNLVTKMQGNYPTASIAGQWKLHLWWNASNIDMGSGMTIDSWGIVRILSKGSNWSPNKYHLFNVDWNAQIRSWLYVWEFFSNNRPASINFQFSGYNFQNKDGSTTWIKITNTWNVGIWTASPSSKLEVVWNTKISGDLNIKNNSLYVGGTNSYVGIGTNTPSSKLDVEWTWSFDDLLVSWKINTNNVSALEFQWNNESDYMKFSTMMWGTTRMWNLSINNKNLISAMFDPNDNTNMFIIWEWWISSSFGILKDDWNSAILVDWSNEYNVWIWNDSPYQKLDVSGAIKIWYPATNTWCNINTVWTIQYKNITDGWALSVCVRTKWTPGATYQWINIVVATWWNINSMISLDSWILVWWPL